LDGILLNLQGTSLGQTVLHSFLLSFQSITWAKRKGNHYSIYSEEKLL